LLFFSSPTGTVQVMLSTAHPAKFSDAVSEALKESSQFNFEADVLPVEFKGLLQKPRRAITVERAEVDLVKKVIEERVHL
jgi:threonine synthase